jgi:hypothetical protein
MKDVLKTPVTRTLPSGVKITFTSRRELEKFDDELRKTVEKRRKEAEFDKDVEFIPDFAY